MLRVLYDGEIFSLSEIGGISRYYCEIMDGLSHEPGVEVVLPNLLTANRYLERCRAFHGLGLSSWPRPPGRTRLLLLVNGLAAKAALLRRKADLVHLTYYDTSLLPILRDEPFVITIHDMIPELFASNDPQREAVIAGKKALARRAARIIAGSEWTKQDLIRLLGVAPEAVEVIYYGASDSVICQSGDPTPKDLPESFVLFVGRRAGYKNFGGAMAGIAAVLQAMPELHLLCAGGGPFSAEETAALRALGCAERIVQRSLSDRELGWAYAHATALVFPSLYEGFGIPILEAFANGCPVVVSDRSCMPEVAGEAALYFDPDSADQLAAALERAVADQSLRHRLIEAGRQRVAAFSWRRSVRAHLDLYKRVTEGRA
jgi:glycosyltransferase involved in cell wall biosynthesis